MDKYFEALQKSKGSVALSISSQLSFDETAEILEKGKKAAIGEIRDWKGVKMQKTVQGWEPVKQQSKESIKLPDEKKSLESLGNKLKEWEFPVHGSSITRSKRGSRLKITFPVDQKWIEGSDSYENLESKMQSVLDDHKKELDEMSINYKFDVVPGGRGTEDIACYFRIK